VLVVAALALLAVGHYLYWYSPRPRAAALRPGSFAADLLTAGDYDACLWLPYPHQNLGALADVLGTGDQAGVERYLAAVAQISGLPELEVPHFGPFRAPPAREVVVTASADGERWAVAAQVYPVLAVVARLAGKLAGNPWLAGGTVSLSDRPATVRWAGRLWLLESAAPPRAASSRAARLPLPEGPALSRLVVRRPQGLVLAGSYRLRSQDGVLELAGEAPGEWGSRPGELPIPAVEAPAGERIDGEATAADGPIVAVLFASGDAVGGGARAGVLLAGEGGFSLPGAAVLSRSGGERWRLPGEGILRRLRGELPAGEHAGWQVVAFDRESLARAFEVGERLAPLAARGEDAPTWALWARPGPAARRVEDVAEALEAIPLIGRQRARRWRAWATVLAPLARYDRLTAEIGRHDGEMRLRLQ
jgi:hypothetical protein